MKLRLFLVLVIFYIMAVFGWWLYSFVNYAKKEYKLEYDNLTLKKLFIKTMLTEFMVKKAEGDSLSPYALYEAHRKEVEEFHLVLNKEYRIRTIMHVSMAAHNLGELVNVEIHESELNAIAKNFMRKQRAFYSEVIFFTILVVSGVIWVFGKLESLLNLNKMQNNFLLSITHEFKTPLTAIKLSAQTLQHRRMEPDTQQALMQQMVNNSDRLNDLLDNVMLATRIDGKSYQFSMTDIDITSLIQRTAAMILTEPYFRGKFIFDEERATIHGDEMSLQLVFSNLFQNAVKYAGNTADITVKYARVNSQFIITVSDNGNGIDKKEYKSIFKKFYRVGDENTRETKGTGLGLFLVKQILLSHKAQIRAEANKPKGTSFHIIFKNT